MKKTLIIAAIAICAAALLSSCNKNEIELSVAPSVEKVTFTCTIENAFPDSKVNVAGDGKTTWEAGDAIMIHGGTDGKLRQLVTLNAENISEDGKVATFDVQMEPYDRADANVVSTLYAQYPASLVPEGSMYYECRFTATNDFLMAACNVGNSFKFYNLCGLISFKVNGNFDSFEFCGNNGETVGYGTVYQARVRHDVGQDGPSVNYYKPGNGSGDPVPLKSVASELKDGTNYVFLPAGANFTGGFMFKFYDGNDLVYTAKTTTPVEILPSKMLALGDITSKLEEYVAPQQSDHKSEITNAADLSSLQANCFVITAPGAYKFPALKGNSEEAAGNVFGAEIVWESYNNAEEVAANSVIAAVDFEDNWMYFKTPDTLKPGNAVIAAKDSQDHIIWSWHIWIPSTDIATDTYGLFNHELMDRNLGALVAAAAGEAAPVESFGLTYQWGRKDPFVGPAATSGSTVATVAGTASAAAAGQISVAESIANPTLLGHADDGDWLTAPDNTLWQNDTKTIYDPCPAGYKVPARDKNQPLMGSDLSTVTGWSESAEYGIVTMGNPLAVFPVSGYRDDYEVYQLAKVYQRVAYWTSYASADAKGYLLNIRLADYGNAHALSEGPKARGAYVRCVKLEEAAGGEQPQDPSHTDVAVTLDGDVSEWANVEAISNSGDIKEWKYTSDSNNLYFYFKISAASIKCSEDCTYKWKRYIYMGFDTDNNAATGQVEGLPGGLKIVGCEANALVYPFRGTAPAADAYPEGVEFINGEDEESWIKLADGTTTDSKITAYGFRDGDFIYLEVGVPRAGVGSPAAGKVNVQFSLSWNLTETETITIL